MMAREEVLDLLDNDGADSLGTEPHAPHMAPSNIIAKISLQLSRNFRPILRKK